MERIEQLTVIHYFFLGGEMKKLKITLECGSAKLTIEGNINELEDLNTIVDFISRTWLQSLNAHENKQEKETENFQSPWENPNKWKIIYKTANIILASPIKRMRYGHHSFLQDRIYIWSKDNKYSPSTVSGQLYLTKREFGRLVLCETIDNIINKKYRLELIKKFKKELEYIAKVLREKKRKIGVIESLNIDEEKRKEFYETMRDR